MSPVAWARLQGAQDAGARWLRDAHGTEFGSDRAYFGEKFTTFEGQFTWGQRRFSGIAEGEEGEARKGGVMKLSIYNQAGDLVGDRDYSIPIFEEGRGVVAVKFAIEAIQANMRQGNASTKTRGDVNGGGKKPFRQKGTGHARQGSNRSPLMPGGGIVFGPHPRNYYKKVNKKVKKLALARALYDCAEGLQISIVEQFGENFSKTKDFSAFIGKVFPSGSVLLVDAYFSDALMYSARNMAHIFMIDAGSINALDLKSYDHFLMSEGGFMQLLERVR
jgi:large subunit ribosomal protein L4